MSNVSTTRRHPARITYAAAVSAPTTDYAPVGLLNNGAYVESLRDRIAKNRGDEDVIFLYVTTPTGGSEYRPMSRFDVLPTTQRFFRRLWANKKPTYIAVGEQIPADPAPAVGPAPAAPPAPPAPPVVVADPAPTTPPPADPVPEVSDADNGLRYRKSVVKGRTRYLELADGESAETVYRRVGSGKSTRYVEVS